MKLFTVSQRHKVTGEDGKRRTVEQTHGPFPRQKAELIRNALWFASSCKKPHTCTYPFSACEGGPAIILEEV